MIEYVRMARVYFVLLAIFAIGRWLQGVLGFAYEDAHQVFSIVILTLLSSFYYAAFGRRWFDLTVARALGLALFMGLASQAVIFAATVASYGLGIETFYNHPRALRVPGAVSLSQALLIRVTGLVANTLLTVFAAALGWALGALLPDCKPGERAD